MTVDSNCTNYRNVVLSQSGRIDDAGKLNVGNNKSQVDKGREAGDRKSGGWSLILRFAAGVYAVWLMWLAYVAWVNINAGNQ